MDYERFIATVRDAAHVNDQEAARVACATLATLSERISAGEAEDIADRLPPELGGCVRPQGRPEPFALDTFMERLSRRAQLDQPTAERDARAVFAALWSALGPEEYHDMRAELPRDFYPLLDEAISMAAGPAPGTPPSAEPFHRLVAQHSETLDAAGAPAAVEAVLEALAMRISGGQAEDLAAHLAPEVRAAIERGRARKGTEHALAMGLEEFLDEIARLEGVDREQARDHARAVLLALAQTVPAKEWKDTWDQLPDEFRRLTAAHPS